VDENNPLYEDYASTVYPFFVDALSFKKTTNYLSLLYVYTLKGKEEVFHASPHHNIIRRGKVSLKN